MNTQSIFIVAASLGAVACAAGSGGYGTGGPTPRSAAREGAVATGGRGAAFGYRSVDDARYTLYRWDSLTLHLPGGAKQRQSLERTAYLRLSLVEDGDGYQATIVLDSLQAKASAIAVPADSLAPLRGMRWTASVSPTGVLRDLSADRSTTFGDQLTNHLRLLFPVLPSGGAKVGSEWSDSAVVPVRADAFNATERLRASYRAVDDSRGIKIEGTGAYSRTGKGQRFQQEMEMTATGKRQDTFLLGKDGIVLSADGTDVGEMTITVPSNGQTVPVDQLGKYRIRAAGR